MGMDSVSQAKEAARRALTRVDARELEIGGAIFVVSLVGSMALSAFMLCRLPEDYLRRQEGATVLDGRPRWQRVLLSVGKNVLGVLLVALGIVLSLPGVPGQGVLTILIGVMLLDIPGKERVERWLFSRP